MILFFEGIGSDNALIYCKVWDCAKSDKTSVIFLKLIRDTLRHAWVSVFAASATTCLAFFAGYFSDITSIKCFRYQMNYQISTHISFEFL